MNDMKKYKSIEGILKALEDGTFPVKKEKPFFTIFQDERGKQIENEYKKVFGTNPFWSFEEETMDECYDRLEKEIKEEKNDFKGFDDSNYFQDLEDMKNHTGRFSPERKKERDVRPGESLWDYLKRKENKENKR